MERKTSYVYCICRISQKEWPNLEYDLFKRGYKHIIPVIPTVRILKKSKAGKNTFNEVPLLFNYGFIRMSSKKAYNRQFLNQLKRDIPGILGWVHDSCSMHPKKKRARVDNAEDFDDFSKVATVTRDQVKFYKKMAKRNQVYSINEITSLKKNDYVILKGYPFEGISAQIEDVNLSTRIATVTIFPERGSLKIQLPMDNILYTIYNGFDEDKLLCSAEEVDLSRINITTEEE